MDGSFDKLEELIYVESHLSATSAKFYGEITQQLLKNSAFPGSNNGTGLFQTICGLKIREVYEKVSRRPLFASKRWQIALPHRWDSTSAPFFHCNCPRLVMNLPLLGRY